MDLCFVNVEKLRKFKLNEELRIELIYHQYDEDDQRYISSYNVNGQEVLFTQKKFKQYSIGEEIKLLRETLKIDQNGVVFNKY